MLWTASGAANVRFWGKSGHAVLHCKCPPLTQSGHQTLNELCPNLYRWMHRRAALCHIHNDFVVFGGNLRPSKAYCNAATVLLMLQAPLALRNTSLYFYFRHTPRRGRIGRRAV